MAIFNRAFGIEIEVKGNPSITAVQSKLHAAGLTTWRVVLDGSVDCGVEVVSPKLQGSAGLVEVEKAANTLRDMGLFVDHDCGLHVHVDAEGLSGYTLANIVKRYAAFESVIDSWMTFQRRENRNGYICSTTRVNFPSSANPRIVASHNGNRYYKVNLNAFLRHGTVEFRQHHGTLSSEEIQNWIKFCIQFVENSTVTVTERTIPGNGSLRANAIEKKYAALMKRFIEEKKVSVGAVATIFDCNTTQVSVRMSQFRSWLCARGANATVGRLQRNNYWADNFDCECYARILQDPAFDRVETAINFEEPGLFHGLNPSVEAHFNDRTEANKLLESFTFEPPTMLAA